MWIKMENDKILGKLHEMRNAIDYFYDTFDKVCTDGCHDSLNKKLKLPEKWNKLTSEDIKQIQKIRRKMVQLKALLE